MSKRFVGNGLALLGAAFLFGQAQAADLPMKALPMAPAPVMNWTGFYVGVNGGFGGNEVQYPFSLGPIPAIGIGAIAVPAVGNVAGSASLTNSGNGTE